MSPLQNYRKYHIRGMPRPIFFTKPNPTPLSFLCRRLTRAHTPDIFLANYLHSALFVCTALIIKRFKSVDKLVFCLHSYLHAVTITHPLSALVCTLPTLLCADCEGTSKRLWEVVISVAPNGAPASRNRLSACRSRANTVLNGVQASCRQSADECSCVQMVSTRHICLIINAVHTKSAECRQNGEITKNGVRAIRYYHETAEKPTRDEAAEKCPTRDASPPLERNFLV